MKKLLIVFITLIAMYSCASDMQAKKMQTKIHTTDGLPIYALKFEYDGHRYIEFTRIGPDMYDNYTGYVHDPDCPCHKNDQ